MHFRYEWLNKILGRLAIRLSAKLSKRITDALSKTDIFIIDSGSSVTYFPELKRQFPAAKFIYNAADSLRAVGAPSYLLPMERIAIMNSDLVRCPSSLLAKILLGGSNILVIPQGVLVDQFNICHTSPYPSGTINIVSIGSTLIDLVAIADLARSHPQIQVHVLGLTQQDNMPTNAIFHGEVSFRETIPFVKFANAGLAAYKLDEGSAYIAESSLKLLQYRFCNLPIIAPEMIPDGEDVFTYIEGDEGSIARATTRALGHFDSKSPRNVSILSWDDVAGRLLRAIGELGAGPFRNRCGEPDRR
ncbi:hypothetical protein PBT88_06970 [Sphingomonas abietis]|uniref:Glucuronosyltransferase GumK N-terminal domain-containing protein n=2 Tax=Sphingomonas abietis TaxID=3012344 RepID=A0ABY7NQM5_9SPHN|nr:hypothetical protein [Sphingomonas abietis]WBO23854.1 hypothetical protein PBT88_06970 [Sphingomonas abietis]